MPSPCDGVTRSVFGRTFHTDAEDSINQQIGKEKVLNPVWLRCSSNSGNPKANRVQTYFLDNPRTYTALKVGSIVLGLLALSSLVMIFHFCPAAHHAWIHGAVPVFQSQAFMYAGMSLGGVAALAMAVKVLGNVKIRVKFPVKYPSLNN